MFSMVKKWKINILASWAPKRLTTTVAVFNSAKIAIIIRITIEAMVVDCFFMENSPSCFL